jgi:hypothetical protein
MDGWKDVCIDGAAMYLFIYLFIYMYVCMYVCTYVRTGGRTNWWMDGWMDRKKDLIQKQVNPVHIGLFTVYFHKIHTSIILPPSELVALIWL